MKPTWLLPKPTLLLLSAVWACCCVACGATRAGVPLSALATHGAAAPALDAAACPELDHADRGALPAPAPALPSDGGADAAVVAEKVHDAAMLMETGGLDDALALLAKTAALAPTDPELLYWTAYGHYLKKDWSRTIDLLLRDTDRFGPLGYQLLGTTYDDAGKPACAVRIFSEGLTRHPNEGGLYLELGVVYARANDFVRALEWWERGIAAAPRHPSNYYHAARLLMLSREPLWALLYGEAFVNLEPASERALEMSRLLLAVYRDVLRLTRRGERWEAQVLFTETLSRSDDAAPPISATFPARFSALFAQAAADVANEGGVTDPAALDVDSLHRIRQAFLRRWLAQPATPAVPEHPILALDRRVLEAGHFDAYDYWLLRGADSAPLESFAAKNEDAFALFAEYMATAPLAPANGAMPRSGYGAGVFVGTDATVSRAQALGAIAAFFAEPFSDTASSSCERILRFASESPEVDVLISPEVLPWLATSHENPTLNEAIEENGALLLCAFVAGNVRAQLARGERRDSPLEGITAVLDIYAQLKTRIQIEVPSLEDLAQRRAAGALGTYLEGRQR